VLEAHACLAHMDYTAKRLSRFKELVEQTLLLVFFFVLLLHTRNSTDVFFSPTDPTFFRKHTSRHARTHNALNFHVASHGSSGIQKLDWRKMEIQRLRRCQGQSKHSSVLVFQKKSPFLVGG
jgi:hypothetical protein